MGYYYHRETGDKVIYIEGGWSGEGYCTKTPLIIKDTDDYLNIFYHNPYLPIYEKASKYLKTDTIYTVFCTGGCSGKTWTYLEEFPNIMFDSHIFEHKR